jgi:hypothetical protein
LLTALNSADTAKAQRRVNGMQNQICEEMDVIRSLLLEVDSQTKRLRKAPEVNARKQKQSDATKRLMKVVSVYEKAQQTQKQNYKKQIVRELKVGNYIL